jgi:hypothetical protein
VSGPTIPNRQHAVLAGVACIVAGSWLLYDAYDARGHRKPFWMKLLPGA